MAKRTYDQLRKGINKHMRDSSIRDHRLSQLARFYEATTPPIVDEFMYWVIQGKGELYLRVDKDGEFVELRPLRDGFVLDEGNYQYDLVLRKFGKQYEDESEAS